jgi:hypothetical protein
MSLQASVSDWGWVKMLWPQRNGYDTTCWKLTQTLQASITPSQEGILLNNY